MVERTGVGSRKVGIASVVRTARPEGAFRRWTESGRGFIPVAPIWRESCKAVRSGVLFAGQMSSGSRAKRAASLLVSGVFALATMVGMWGGANASGYQLWRYSAETPVEADSEVETQTPASAWEPAREASYPALPERPAYSIYWPEGPAGPKPVVIALHGIGGNGPGMAPLLLSQARANGWVLVAPTIPYGEWRDPAQLTGE